MKNTFVNSNGNIASPADISAAIMRAYNNGDRTKFLSHSAATLKSMVSYELNERCSGRHCA